MLRACAYCLDLSAWSNRIRQYDLPVSQAGERPQIADYLDGKRHLKPLPFAHNGREIET